MSHNVIARSEATRQSIYPLCRSMDCFASLAMTWWRSLPSQIPKRLIQPIKRFHQNRTRCSKIETQPGFAAGPELLAGAGKNPRPVLDPRGHIRRRQSGSGEIDPAEIG